MAPAGQIVKDFALTRINLIPGAHALVQRIRQGSPLLLARDPNDKFDPNSIMVIYPAPGSKRKIGYMPLGLAKELAPLMDAGVNIIARKAPNPLYGVCQVAYIPPAQEVIATEQPKVIEPAPEKALETLADEPVELQTPKTVPIAIELPEGVTQQDLDAATDLPPLGDSRRSHFKDTDNG